MTNKQPNLKVYSWLGAYPPGMERPADKSHRVQARCVVAVRSMAEMLRIAGLTRSSVPYISETGNAVEVPLALSKPGTVFFQDDLNYTPGAARYFEHPLGGRAY